MINDFLKFLFLLTLTIYSLSSKSSSLFEDSKARGINQTCASYLGQIEDSYELNGLNITFAHPTNPKDFPSLHISTQKYNNGASSFSATLTPDGEYCYVSAIYITSINNQTCKEIQEIKVEENNNLQVENYLEGDYSVISPPDNSYQIILTSAGDQNCIITETRMLWPGK